jgi:hypothetical protein
MKRTLDSLYDEALSFIPKTGLKFVPDSKYPETDIKVLSCILAHCAFKNDFQAVITGYDIAEFLTKKGVERADTNSSISRLNSYLIPQGSISREIDVKKEWLPLYRPSAIFKQMGSLYVEQRLEREA